MPLTYEFDQKLKALEPVLDEHAEWFGQIMRRVLYLEDYEQVEPPAAPGSFASWLETIRQDKTVGAITLERLRQVHEDLLGTAETLVERKTGKPDIRAFDIFLGLYDGFIGQLRRLERDCLLADSGIDRLTALRSRKAMDRDLERELERRSRRGKPFCLILAQIDDYPIICACLDEKQQAEMLEKLGDHIKRCIRSFDDAYRADEAEFVMSLKHTDTTGGTATIARLRRFLEEDPIMIQSKTGKPFPLTLSYCAAEPMPGDVIANMLSHMRADLNRYNTGGNTALEYFEQSPLQRFLQNQEDSAPVSP